MNSRPLQIRLSQFLLQQTCLQSPLLSPLRLSQLHSLLITTGLHSTDQSSLLSLLKLYLSNPSTLPHATTLFHQSQEPKKWNIMIRHVSAATPSKALSLFQEMRESSTPFQDDPFVYASLIKACNKAGAFLEGKSVHGYVVRLGLDSNANVLNSLVSFYMGSADLMSYADVLFSMVWEKSVVSVNCMISGNVNRGNLDEGLRLLVEMLSGCFGSNVRPSYVTFLILISGCVEFGNRGTGNALHCCCCKIGLDGNTEICNALINLYGKFGCIVDAANVFREMSEKDLISWNAMIWGYANSGDCGEAFSLFRKMRIDEIGIDRVSLSCFLSSCRDLCLGMMLHAHAKSTGMESDISVGTALINMYAKCRKIESARKLFDELPLQNIEHWNALIHAYIENKLPKEALKLLDRIRYRKLKPDEVTILGLIMACRDTGELHKGNLVHSIVENDELLKRSVVLGNALIDMYAKCGSITKTRYVFDKMPKKDVVSWTSMIVGHAVNGEGDKSLATFKQMCARKIVPNSITFIGVLSACAHSGLLAEGRTLYDRMHDVYRIRPQIEHCGCMVDMLARSGNIEDARDFIRNMPVEPNAFVWRMLINACRVHGQINLGLNLISDITELNTSEDFVISSNIYAEAGRWGDVISRRNFMVVHNDPKEAGKSCVR